MQSSPVQPPRANAGALLAARASLALVAAWYLVGFFVYEDTMNGMREDFIHFHRPAVETFANLPFGEAIRHHGLQEGGGNIVRPNDAGAAP